MYPKNSFWWKYSTVLDLVLENHVLKHDAVNKYHAEIL